MPALVAHLVLSKSVGNAPLKATVVNAVLPPPVASADKLEVLLSQKRRVGTTRNGPLVPDT